MKLEIQNTKYKILSFKKLVPGLILFSFILSGILAPVSFSDKKYPSVEIKTVSAQETSAGLDPNQIAGEQKQVPAASDPTSGTGTLRGSAQSYTKSGGKTAASSSGNNNTDNVFTCNIVPIFGGGGSAQECIGSLVYYLIFVPATYIIALAGQLFDITMAFTLSSKVLNSDFARDGWVVTRDLANMFFIFILLYIAIATILNIAGYNAKALLARLVIVALLLNFSLFATRVVIDASNILALAFYNSISVSSKTIDAENSEKLKNVFGIAPKEISVGFVDFFKPTKLLGITSASATEIGKFVKDNLGKLIFVYLFSAAIILVAAWVFLSVAFLFITRTAILWFLMATAPIAFAAMILPKTRSLFEKWWGELISKSFCVAVLLFFIWLITKFAETSFLRGLGGGNFNKNNISLADNGFLITALMMLLQFSTLVILLLVAKQQTQKMCGAVAGFSMNFVSGLGTKAAGFLAGGIGGAALRNTLGAKAFSLAESKKEDWGSGNVLQRLALQGARKVSGASFDVRGTKLGGTAELGKASGRGGYRGAIDKRVREDTAWAKSFGEGEKADRAREAFVGKLNEMSGDSAKGILGRIITGRGVLSKVEPEKAAKAIKKTIYATEKAREEEVELKEMKNKILEEQPAEVKDEKGNVVYAYKNMNDIEAAVKSSALSQINSERIVKEAMDSYGKSLKEKLSSAKVDLKGFETSRNTQGVAKMTSEIEKLTEAARSLEKMDKLENRIENRNQRRVDRQEREDAQKSSPSGVDKGKK